MSRRLDRVGEIDCVLLLPELRDRACHPPRLLAVFPFRPLTPLIPNGTVTSPISSNSIVVMFRFPMAVWSLVVMEGIAFHPHHSRFGDC